MATPTCWLLGAAWDGIYYMPSPTISVQGHTAASGQSGVIAIGATAWTVYDHDGATVGSGTMLSTDTEIAVATTGTWAGGATVEPGFYTVVTNSGTNGVVSGSIAVCPANSNLYVPVAAGDSTWYLAAWMASANDRDNYQFPAQTTAQILNIRSGDPYFTGPQDSERPRQFWVSTSTQSSSPTWAPTTAEWQSFAQALVGGGYTGAVYECPSNEPEYGGWTVSATVAQFNTLYSTIKAVDSTAKVIGWCSYGLDPTSPTNWLTTFLADCTPDGFSIHFENSHQNASNIVLLRQYIGGIDKIMVAAGMPNLPLHLTETGINGGLYGVLQPRRDARQRTVLRLVMESYGHPKEQCYDFPVYDHLGSGLSTYLAEFTFDGSTGSLRAGIYAVHVMSEALFGMPCSRTNRPAALNFGGPGTLGDSLFMGLHYSGPSGDRVVLATNGIESATVTLSVSGYADGATVTCWDGWGRSSTVTVSAGEITVPVNDLLTYVFLAAGTTVGVVDSDQGVITKFNRAINQANVATTVTDEASANVAGVPNNGSFAENASGFTTAVAPYSDSTLPASLTIDFTGPTEISGFSLFTGQPAWQGAGCSIIEANLVATVGGAQQTLWSYTCASAVSEAIPSPDTANSADLCVRTTWWTGPFAFLESFTPVEATSVTLNITSVSWGGQPDSAASSATGGSTGPENDAQVFRCAEFQVYTPWATSILASSSAIEARRI